MMWKWNSLKEHHASILQPEEADERSTNEKLPNWSLSAISHSFIELQILPVEASIHQLQMQFKKAVEDSKEGHTHLIRKEIKGEKLGFFTCLF